MCGSETGFKRCALPLRSEEAGKFKAVIRSAGTLAPAANGIPASWGSPPLPRGLAQGMVSAGCLTSASACFFRFLLTGPGAAGRGLPARHWHLGHGGPHRLPRDRGCQPPAHHGCLHPPGHGGPAFPARLPGLLWGRPREQVSAAVCEYTHPLPHPWVPWDGRWRPTYPYFRRLKSDPSRLSSWSGKASRQPLSFALATPASRACSLYWAHACHVGKLPLGGE